MNCKMFVLGLAVGMIGGAILVANSKKAKDLVEKGQDEVKKQIGKIKKKSKKSQKKNGDAEDKTETEN